MVRPRDTEAARSSVRDGFELLDDVLANLETVVPQQLEILRGMREQLGVRQVRVVVLGEAKRGKSSLINALAGRDLLPTGVIPVTAVVTEVRRDPADAMRVRYLDGREERLGLDQVHRYVTEDHNPANRRRVRSVEMLVADLPWPPAVLFVDTPGTGSIEEQHDRVATSAARAMDVALVVLTSDPPISARERHQLSVAATQSAQVVVVLAKADLLTEPELESVMNYTRNVILEAAGRDVEMIPVSTRNSKAAPHPGLSRVRDVVTSLATDPLKQTLVRSVRERTRRLVQAVRDDVGVSMSLAEMDSAEASARARVFMRALEEARAQNRHCAELVHAAVRSINTELDASLGSAKGALVKTLLELPELASDRIDKPDEESPAIDRLTNLATASAESWRRESSSQVERDLAQIGRRATSLMAAAISELRDVARDELGVELVIDFEPISLPADASFFYVQKNLTDAATAISEALRHRLPRGLRRRSVTRYLRESATMLADRQLGRARGDLRLRLSDVERTLVHQVETVTRELLDRLGDAAATAEAMAYERQDLRREQLAVLARRADALGNAMRELDHCGGGAP